MFAPISTQVQAVVDTLRSFVLQVQPYSNAPPLQISVKGGLHDKCRSEIQLDEISIGSDPGNDFVLLDTAVAGEHIRVAVSYSLLGPLAIVTATGADAKANGTIIEQGKVSKHLRLPLDISFGDDISLSLHKQTARQPRASFAGRLIRQLTTSVAVLVALTAGLLFWEASGERMFVLRQSYPSAVAPDKPAQVEISAEVFRSKLNEAGLGETLRVAETADGFLEVRGRLSPSQARVWESVAVWYDTVSFAKPMLTFFKSAGELPQMPPISLVRLSAPKEIVLSTGKAIGVNATLSDDWKVAAIEQDHIVIARGGDREVLWFAGPRK